MHIHNYIPTSVPCGTGKRWTVGGHALVSASYTEHWTIQP